MSILLEVISGIVVTVVVVGSAALVAYLVAFQGLR